MHRAVSLCWAGYWAAAALAAVLVVGGKAQAADQLGPPASFSRVDEPLPQGAAARSDALSLWQQGFEVVPLLPRDARHTIHSYYVASPESPDGRHVVYFSSTAADAHRGDVCIVDRTTRQQTVLARDVSVEDAHRVACQQWLSAGRHIVYHDLRHGVSSVVIVDVVTARQHVLAAGRQVGFGQPHANLVLLYGPHWDPEGFRDLELLDVQSGQSRTVLTADAVRAVSVAHGAVENARAAAIRRGCG
jgi:hypothetical protein